MSELTVAKITTENDTTPLLFTTGNTSGGFIKVETANDDVIFAGTARFTGNVPAISPAFAQANTARSHANVSFAQANTARDHANVSFAQANTARDHANVSFAQANTARDEANTKTSTGKAIAMAIVFG